jgi:hypothetical protein
MENHHVFLGGMMANGRNGQLPGSGNLSQNGTTFMDLCFWDETGRHIFGLI